MQLAATIVRSPAAPPRNHPADKHPLSDSLELYASHASIRFSKMPACAHTQ